MLVFGSWRSSKAMEISVSLHAFCSTQLPCSHANGISLNPIHAPMLLFSNRRTEDLASPLWRGTLRVESRFRVYLKWKDTQAKYVLHTAANGLCILLYSWFLIETTICSTQEGCMKPGDKLLAVNGESVLGYTVEKVTVSLELENCTHHVVFPIKARIWS